MASRAAGRSRIASFLLLLSICTAVVSFSQLAWAHLPSGGSDAKITLCHRTNSATNPYVVITVDRSAADGIAGNSGNEADHFGEHQGPVASSLEVAQQLKDDKIEWGDIIPPVDNDAVAMPHSGLNWTAEGQAVFNAGCAFPTQTSPPPTSPPPTSPPPTSPPPTSPPTSPPPTSPPTAISVAIQKTNDANVNGTFTNNERSDTEGLDVDFKLEITNTSDVEVEITALADSFDGTTLDLLATKCSSLVGVTLDPTDSVTCRFTLEDYSPAANDDIVNTAEVCVRMVSGDETACDTNPSRVHTPNVLGKTVRPNVITTPPGGLAFTGPAQSLWLGAVALALFMTGSGLLWAGCRRRRQAQG